MLHKLHVTTVLISIIDDSKTSIHLSAWLYWLIDWFSFFKILYNFLKGVHIPSKILSKIGAGSKLGSNIHVFPRESGFENYQKWRLDSRKSHTVRYILFIQFFFISFLIFVLFLIFPFCMTRLARTLALGRLLEINLANSAVFPESLVLRSIVLDWVLIYRKWSLRPVIIRMTTKSDNRAAGVRFVYHRYDYRPNWTTRCVITN